METNQVCRIPVEKPAALNSVKACSPHGEFLASGLVGQESHQLKRFGKHFSKILQCHTHATQHPPPPFTLSNTQHLEVIWAGGPINYLALLSWSSGSVLITTTPEHITQGGPPLPLHCFILTNADLYTNGPDSSLCLVSLGVFICRGKEDALVTRNMVPGESVYGEKRISVEVGSRWAGLF